MKNISELTKKGNYILENVDGLNRVIRIRNSYGDIICSIFVLSGLLVMNTGYIFNYYREVKESIEKVGLNTFIKPLLK